MGWLYVDDGFPEHPKALAAGGDACWLWVCAFAYVNRNHSEGYIPKAMVPRLSDRKNPAKLAKRLVEVGLWEDKGDSFYMHDYLTWNASALARKAKARKAAEARWGGTPSNAPPDAPSIANASSEHVPDDPPSRCSSDVMHMPSPNPIPNPSISISVDNFNVGRIPGVAETEKELERAKALAVRMAEAIASSGSKPNPKRLVEVVRWALTYMDWAVVDEAIGYSLTLDNPPQGHGFFVTQLRSWASQRGVKMPEFGAKS